MNLFERGGGGILLLLTISGDKLSFFQHTFLNLISDSGHFSKNILHATLLLLEYLYYFFIYFKVNSGII